MEKLIPDAATNETHAPIKTPVDKPQSPKSQHNLDNIRLISAHFIARINMLIFVQEFTS